MVQPAAPKRKPRSPLRIGIFCAVVVLFVVAGVLAVIYDRAAHPWSVQGGASFEKVDDEVKAANQGASWRSHMKVVRPAGPSPFGLYDLAVDTDLNEDSVSDTALAIEICEAYTAAAAPDTGVVVNGLKYPAAQTLVDGKQTQPPPRSSKMADNLGGHSQSGRICGKA
jgi:hypothetical protein